ncbi:nuclear pore complex protein Nup50 [Caerostris darwini]|uniref:Nuclear pore complex protein Nup50 n=1 Tax=Caerostris darwini TaxID=1538125 RepID=A0AAV4RVL1_9ARAC|nr:nuclear pore complex protein Nup50 [Caerostris darwini]
MAKRGASNELNQDNWDQVDEPEEAGNFTPLNKDELKNRVIKKAKRSLTNNSSGSQGFSPFAKFTGFASASPFSSVKTSFNADNSSFNTSVTKKDAESSNGTSSEQEKSSGDAKPAAVLNTKPKEKQTRDLEYYKRLQSLNESVMKWMQLHLAKNPCCDFTPVFNDYKKHIDTLNVSYPVQVKESTAVTDNKKNFKSSAFEDKTPKDSTNYSVSNDNVQKEKSAKNEDETDYGANFSARTTNTSTFSFGIRSTPTPTSSSTSGGCTSSSKEEIEKKTEKEEASAPFSFFAMKPPKPNSDMPFSFACNPVEQSASNSEKEEVEYVPPKNDFVTVTEEDALYSKRCKMFFKKGDAYTERGLGTLYLKPLDGKTQLLIRADTSLGNILLNIMLNASLPMSRTGKNNVLLVCIPNPPVDAKNPNSKEAIPILIRVKSAEEADELLETLNKYKS